MEHKIMAPPPIRYYEFVMSADEQAQYIKAMQTVINVVSQRTPINENDPILGKGNFTWPKGPGEPRSVHFDYVLKIPEFRAYFGRKSDDGLWEQGGILFHDGSTPLSNFKDDTFIKTLGLEFVKLQAAERQSGCEYHYHLSNNDSSRVEVIFRVLDNDYTAENYCNSKEVFPKSPVQVTVLLR